MADIEELLRSIAASRAADPLAPMTVIVPSHVAGLHLRRRLGRMGAFAGVRFESDPTGGLANLVCVTVEGVEAEPILLALDQRGIAIHSGSACSSESLEPSPVLEAMGADADHALRISTGWSTTDADVDALLGALPDVVRQFRAMRG